MVKSDIREDTLLLESTMRQNIQSQNRLADMIELSLPSSFTVSDFSTKYSISEEQVIAVMKHYDMVKGRGKIRISLENAIKLSKILKERKRMNDLPGTCHGRKTNQFTVE